MWEFIASGSIGGAVLLAASWYFKKYINSYVDHEFNKRIETFKAELQTKHQEQQHFHEICDKLFLTKIRI